MADSDLHSVVPIPAPGPSAVPGKDLVLSDALSDAEED